MFSRNQSSQLLSSPGEENCSIQLNIDRVIHQSLTQFGSYSLIKKTPKRDKVHVGSIHIGRGRYVSVPGSLFVIGLHSVGGRACSLSGLHQLAVIIIQIIAKTARAHLQGQKTNEKHWRPVFLVGHSGN